MLYTATCYTPATFSNPHVAEIGQLWNGIWLAFATNWCVVNTGYPNKFCTKQKSALKLERWKQLADSNSIQLLLSEIEAYTSLGTGKQFQNLSTE